MTVVAVWLGVMLLGGAGAVARFHLDRAVSKRIGRPFPFGTLAVNLSGAMLLGFFAGIALSPHVALLAGTGFVGSYTTFSTFMWESFSLGRTHHAGLGAVYVVVSIAAGLLAAVGGYQLARSFA